MAAAQPSAGPKTIIIGISGPSSSGKTTLARLLREVFAIEGKLRTFIIHEDDFYYPDDKIPVTTTAKGEKVQDWDTIGAINVSFLTASLGYVREHGTLPPRLRSKEDQNPASDPGVDRSQIEKLRAAVSARLSEAGSENQQGLVVAFMEGFLLYAPPPSEAPQHVLRPVHKKMHLHLFLPAPYDLVKARREARSGYVTIGPAPTPVKEPGEEIPGMEGLEPVDLEKNGQELLPEHQNFWTDPPGYVDDIVWPRYVRDHAWLLLPEDEQQEDGSRSPSLDARFAAGQDQTEQELLRLAGQAVNVRTDAGVRVAPGQGRIPMTEVLDWAVEEVLQCVTSDI